MELYTPRPRPIGAVFWAAIAILFLVFELNTRSLHWQMAALPPAMLAFGLWIGRRREFRGRLTETALEVDSLSTIIPYEAIEGLTIGGLAINPEETKLKPRPLLVMHRGGVLEIPAMLNVPVLKVYEVLLAALPTTSHCTLSPPMAEYFEKEKNLFGNERVHAFCRRKYIGRRPSTLRGQLCCGLLFLCGIIWCLMSSFLVEEKNAKEYQVWFALGIELAVVSFLAWIYLLAKQALVEVRARKLKNAELIISPSGIAVRQGDTVGHIRWDELLDVRFIHKPRKTVTLTRKSATIGLTLYMAGANFRIADVYNRPIAFIYRLIQKFWKKS